MKQSSRLTRIALLCIGVMESLVVLFHVLGVQETPNWHWPWRNGRAWPLYPAMAIAAIPLAVAIGLWQRGLRATALGGIFLSVVAFQIVGQVMASNPPDWLRPCAIIEDRICSSYWSDARKLQRSGESVRAILTDYPTLMRSFYQHSKEKPPGPVLFYLILLKVFGAGGHAASAVGAIAIALGTAAGVPLTYLLARAMLNDRDAAFWAAALYAVVPSVVAIYPMFDSCYPAVVCAMALLWIAAIRTGRWRHGIALGLAVLLASLFAYNLLVSGTFLLGLMLIECGCGGRDHSGWRRAALASMLAAGAILGGYVLLWCLSGFNPLVTFRAAIGIQQHVNVIMHRSYPQTILYDFFDFLFGTGRMLALLAAIGIAGSGGAGRQHDCRDGWFLRLCLLQILLVGSTGLLRGETARVWCFLVPLVTIPAGMALNRWPRRWRYVALAVQALLMLFMVQNVEFSSLSLPGS